MSQENIDRETGANENLQKSLELREFLNDAEDEGLINIKACGEIDKSPLPPEESPDKCPECGCTEFESGFGLAGGGYGVYESCSKCHAIVSKAQEA